MIKQTVTYNDWNGEAHTEDFYFHIAKADITDHLDLEEQFKTLHATFSGKERNLTVPEVQQLLNVIKRLIEIGLGQRSPDGKYFRKSPEIWDHFRWSGAYDVFLMSLFEEPQKAMEFMVGIIPDDLRKEAEAKVAADSAPAKKTTKK